MYIISSYTLINGISYHLFFFAILQLLCAVLDDMLMSGLSIPIVTTAVCCSRWHIRRLLTSSTQNQKGNKEESSDCQQHPCGLGQHFWRSFEPRWKVDKITTLSHEHGYGNNSPLWIRTWLWMFLWIRGEHRQWNCPVICCIHWNWLKSWNSA